MHNIPDSILESVTCLLRPYGVDFPALLAAQTTPETRGYMTAKQAASYCGLSPKTIRCKALAGELKSLKLGTSEHSRILIPVGELERWLSTYSTPATVRE